MNTAEGTRVVTVGLLDGLAELCDLLEVGSLSRLGGNELLELVDVAEEPGLLWGLFFLTIL